MSTTSDSNGPDAGGSNAGNSPEGGSRPAGSEADGEDQPVLPQSFKRRHWGKLLLLTLVMMPVLVFALWSAIALNWSYSSGPRAGYVQKISHKGYICKTWEGVLYTDLNGFRADSFLFTVRNDSIARVLQTLVGKRVSVDYDQHVNVPSSCFGDTEYFVTGVRELQK